MTKCDSIYDALRAVADYYSTLEEEDRHYHIPFMVSSGEIIIKMRFHELP